MSRGGLESERMRSRPFRSTPGQGGGSHATQTPPRIRPSAKRTRPTLLDTLEPRTLFAAPTLAALPNVTLLAGTQLQIPLDGFDADGDALTYTFTAPAGTTGALSNPANRSLKINVSHTSSGATDPAFTGAMTISLFEDRAPKTTARIIQLAQSGFYNNLLFHRVYPNFVIQGGDPLGNGTGGSGVDFDDEFHKDLRFTGTGLLAMAKSLDDTNDSQFFITEGPTRHLDFNHTIFGQLVEGEDVREKIGNVPVNSATAKPLGAVTMTSVTVVQDTQNRVLSLSAPAGATGSGAVTVTVSDGKGGTAQRTFNVTIAPDTTNSLPYLLPIPDVSTTANTPVSIQIPAFDVDGGPIAYLDWNAMNQLYGNGAQYLPPDPAGNVVAATDLPTGLTTVTPKNNVAGVFPLYLGVTVNNNPGYQAGFDSQVVPLFVSPAAPSGIDLLDVSDTGPIATDNMTRLNNANAANRMQFRISGVNAGAEVKLLDGAKVLGTAVVPAGQTEVVLTTNGAQGLSDGIHNLSATQSLNNVAWTVGNRSGTTTLSSVTSSTLMTLRIDTLAPTQVGAATTDYKLAPPSVTYAFSEDVAASLAAGDVALRNLNTGQDVAPASFQMTYDPATRKATFRFLGLPDGYYRVSRVAGAITDLAGNPVAAGTSTDFFVMAADANHDGTVNFADLVVLAQNYNTSGKTFPDGDFNYDGSVNFADLVLLAQRYNTTLTPPPPVAASPAPVATTFESDVIGAFAAPTVQRESSPTKSLFATTPLVKPVAKKPAPVTRPAARR